MTYFYDVRPTSGVYRPAWEDSRASTVSYRMNGSPPQWGDSSDVSYADLFQTYVDLGGGVTALVAVQPASDYPAHPEIDSVWAVNVRMVQHAYGPEGFASQIYWRLRDKRDGTIAAESPISGSVPASYRPGSTTATASYAVVFDSSGPVIPLLRAGNLAVEIGLAAAEPTAEVRIFETSLTIGSEVPDTPPATTTLRRAIVPPVAHANPSLRMLQRGGPGGMSGIPRMIGNPVRGLRQGPGSIY